MEEPSDGSASTPLVVMFGWWRAQDRHLRAYSALFEVRGRDRLVFLVLLVVGTLSQCVGVYVCVVCVVWGAGQTVATASTHL